MTVPKYIPFRKGDDEQQYFKRLGYKQSGAADGGLESTDTFVSRMQACVLLYAAITQSDNPQNPHGLPAGWAYVAR